MPQFHFSSQFTFGSAGTKVSSCKKVHFQGLKNSKKDLILVLEKNKWIRFFMFTIALKLWTSFTKPWKIGLNHARISFFETLKVMINKASFAIEVACPKKEIQGFKIKVLVIMQFYLELMQELFQSGAWIMRFDIPSKHQNWLV